MLQSTIIYKVSDPGNLPLDRNGALVSESGGRQAIALLEGAANPDERLFDVVGRFSISSEFKGVNTFRLDPTCEAGVLRVEPSRVDISEGAQNLTLVSGSAWAAGLVDFAQFYPGSGGPGGHRVEVAPGTQTGQGWATFINSERRTARVYIVNLPGAPWVLEDGVWNNDGKWVSGGVWKF